MKIDLDPEPTTLLSNSIIDEANNTRTNEIMSSRISLKHTFENHTDYALDIGPAVFDFQDESQHQIFDLNC
jgi:hypothetical protein